MKNDSIPPGMRVVFHPNARSEEHTSELQSHHDLVCRLLLEKKNSRRLLCDASTLCISAIRPAPLPPGRVKPPPAGCRPALLSPQLLTTHLEDGFRLVAVLTI